MTTIAERARGITVERVSPEEVAGAGLVAELRRWTALDALAFQVAPGTSAREPIYAVALPSEGRVLLARGDSAPAVATFSGAEGLAARRWMPEIIRATVAGVLASLGDEADKRYFGSDRSPRGEASGHEDEVEPRRFRGDA